MKPCLLKMGETEIPFSHSGWLDAIQFFNGSLSPSCLCRLLNRVGWYGDCFLASLEKPRIRKSKKFSQDNASEKNSDADPFCTLHLYFPLENSIASSRLGVFECDGLRITISIICEIEKTMKRILLAAALPCHKDSRD